MNDIPKVTAKPAPEASFPNGFPWAFLASPAAASVPAWFRVSIKLQGELLDESRRLTTEWMRRRQEAMDSGLQALQAICGCQDPAKAISAYGDWLTAGVKRAMEDADAIREETERVTALGQKAAEELLQAATQAPARA